jgi:hypothetical protein
MYAQSESPHPARRLAAGCGNLATPPGLDHREGQKTNQCVNQFKTFFLSELVLHYTADAANGMHGWHASSNAGLASALGPVMAPFQRLAGFAHETVDFPTIAEECKFQGGVNAGIDALGDIISNTLGIATGLLVPPDYALQAGRFMGNFVPGPGDPNPTGAPDVHGRIGYQANPNPAAAWSNQGHP